MQKKNKQADRKKPVGKKMTPKRKVARKRAVSKQSSLAKKKKFSAKRRRVTSMGQVMATVPLQSGEPRKRQDGQSGDLQGLSSLPTANSESVEELLEEGNDLRAEVGQGG